MVLGGGQGRVDVLVDLAGLVFVVETARIVLITAGVSKGLGVVLGLFHRFWALDCVD